MASRRLQQGVAVLSGVLFAASCEPTADQQPSAALSEDGWELVWQDEFDGANGSRPDLEKWIYDLGGGGWGNNELQTYTDRTENARLEDGMLVIEARSEAYTGANGVEREYTSARLKTLGRFEQNYGRFEARIRMTSGQGVWPAFWMLGADFPEAGWPECGEIDIMENIGREPSIVHGTLHGPGYSGAGGITAEHSLAEGRRFSDDFHVFAVEWVPNTIRFFVDDQLYATRTPADLPSGARWVFDKAFFMLLNVAVGGNWPGPPDATTVFPQKLVVDFVRAYRRAAR